MFSGKTDTGHYMKNSLLIVKDFTFTGLCAPFKAIYAKML